MFLHQSAELDAEPATNLYTFAGNAKKTNSKMKIRYQLVNKKLVSTNRNLLPAGKNKSLHE